MQVTGIAHKIYPAEQVTDSFTKRVLVLKYATNPMYTQFVSFEFTQDAVKALDHIQEGQQVAIDFELYGREWTSPQGETKYFNTLRAWKVMPMQQQQTENKSKELYDNPF